MGKVQKKMGIALSKERVYPDLPFLGWDFQSEEDILTHPDCVGEVDRVKMVDGKEVRDMRPFEFSLVGLCNSAKDLLERSKVRPVWKAKLEGPTKPIMNIAKATVKARQAMGLEITLDEGLRLAYSMLGVDPSTIPSPDVTIPIDYDEIKQKQEDDEVEENQE